MARILENQNGRRNIALTTDDVIMVVQEYQKLAQGMREYEQIRRVLNRNKIYLPEELV